jgi:hypothetical protein
VGLSNERNHNCECGQLETVEHVLKECPLHSAERDYLRKVSPELDPKILLDTKKGLGAVVKFLDSLPQLLCWWFAWLEQLVKVLLSVNLWYRSTGCYVSQVSLNTWNRSWRIRRHQMIELKIRADTATLPVSLRQMFWNSCLLCMSFCFIILFVTIWCKDNKLIIYLYLSI